MITPKLNVRPLEPGEDAAIYIHSITDEHITKAFLDFYYATLEIHPTDPVLLELVRIRNAITQSCRYCLSVRDAAASLGKDAELTVLRFEESDLPDRSKAALRLATEFLGAPSGLTVEAREEALKFFSPEEIVGLLLKLSAFLVNKPRAALGIDGALDPDNLTPGWHVSPRPPEPAG